MMYCQIQSFGQNMITHDLEIGLFLEKEWKQKRYSIESQFKIFDDVIGLNRNEVLAAMERISPYQVLIFLLNLGTS